MKIAIDCRALENKNWAGKEHSLVFILQELKRIDKKNQYLLYLRGYNKKLLDFLSDYEIRQYNLPVPFWQLRVLIDMVKHKVNLVFCPCTYLLPAMNFFINSVVVVYDIVAFLPEARKYHINKVRWKELLTLKLAIKNSKKVISISNNTKNDIVKYFGTKKSKIKTVYLSSKNNFFKKYNNYRNDKILEKYGIKNKYILYVGTIEPRKNVKRLIQAFAAIRNKKKEFKLVIVGKKGWHYDDVFRVVKKLKIETDVIFAGYVPDEDLPYFYYNSECFVYPSLYEGFGIPILEAMSCGIPVITSKNSSLPEVAADASIYVDPYDIGSITAAINRILFDEVLKKKFIKKGFLNIRRFSVEKTISNLLEVFNEFDKKE